MFPADTQPENETDSPNPTKNTLKEIYFHRVTCKNTIFAFLNPMEP